MATPTKEEILTKHTGWLRVRTGEANLSDVIDAIQEYAELYHKEKLMDFLKWLDKMNFLNGMAYTDNERTVNEYLKSKL